MTTPLKKGNSLVSIVGLGLAGATFLLIFAQLCYLLIQGQEYCPGDGCRVIETQTPVSPAIMNACGLVFFALATALFWHSRRQTPLAQRLLGPFLLAGMAAEGVFFTFQWHVGSFCLYCGAILLALALLNLLLGLKQALPALAVFAAVCGASFFLTAPKNQNPVPPDMEQGIFATRLAVAAQETRHFFFQENCPHCKKALALLLQDTKSATLHVHPLSSLQELSLPGLEQKSAFKPEANRAILHMLGIHGVPVLMVQGPEGPLRIYQGERQIMEFLNAQAEQAGKPEQPKPPEPQEAQKPREQSGAKKRPEAGRPASFGRQTREVPLDFKQTDGSCNLNTDCGR